MPAGLVNGELTLFTARQQVSVLHVDDLADFDGRRALALLKDLRQVGAEAPVGSLHPRTRRSRRWVDDFCGALPGASVDHPIEQES